MKILRLEIENIASLPAAEINFEAEPLRSASIFLINGPTGAGKTTILNSICLALFNDAPCLHRSGTATESENISSSNPMQLLRRGAGRGHVELDFADDYGNRFTARWEAHRKRDKPDGSFQKLERALTCHASGESIINHKQINERVAEALGLNFEQFCRTTMLAQGEFSRFLHGKDDEKGEILEKLTGMDLYSRISKEIFSRNKQMLAECEALQREINGTGLLSADDLQHKIDRIAQLKTYVADLESEAKSTQAAIDWLTASEAADKQLELCQTALQTAVAKTLTEEAAADEKLVKKWHETAEIRALASQTSALEVARKSLEEQSAVLASGFANILAGAAYIENKLASTEREELAPVKEQILQLQPEAEVLDHADSIAIVAKQIADSLASEKNHRAEAKAVGNDIEALAPSIDNAEKVCAAAKESLEQKAQALSGCEDALKGIDAKGAAKEAERLAAKIADAESALSALRASAEAKENADAAAKALSDANSDLAEKTVEADNLQSRMPAANELLTAWQKAYESQSSLKSHIAELQKAFDHHKECPLCGSKVEHLRSAEPIAADLAHAIEKRDAAKKAVDELTSSISAAQTSIKVLRKNVKACDDDAKAKSEKAEEAAKTAAEALLKCQCEDADALKALLPSLKENQAEANKTLQLAFDKQAARDKAQKEKDKADKALSKASDNYLKLQNQKQSLAASQASWLAKAEVAKISAEDALSSLNELLSDESKCSYDTYAAVCKSIAERATLRKNLVALEEKLEKNCDAMRTQAKSAKECIDRIATYIAMPDAEVEPKEMANLEQEAANLADSAARHAGAIASNATQRQEAIAKAEEFYALHPEITPTDTELLAAFSKADIDKKQKHLADIAAEVNRAKGALQAAEQHLKATEEAKPQMPEDADIDSLKEQKAQTDKAVKTAESEKAAAEYAIADNERRRKAVAGKEQELKRIAATAAKWAQLNDLFGSADGRKFKTIAQSAVLQVLLHGANHYMQQLAPRYRLSCEPDRLGIFVTDLYSGNARRHSTLLSGGETFVASLALALALADISKQRSRGGILFIDEGFGSLSAEYLNAAVSTLQSLHSLSGGKVGVISHVESMVEQIPVQIRVRRKNRSTSAIEVIG